MWLYPSLPLSLLPSLPPSPAHLCVHPSEPPPSEAASPHACTARCTGPGTIAVLSALPTPPPPRPPPRLPLPPCPRPWHCCLSRCLCRQGDASSSGSTVRWMRGCKESRVVHVAGSTLAWSSLQGVSESHTCCICCCCYCRRRRCCLVQLLLQQAKPCVAVGKRFVRVLLQLRHTRQGAGLMWLHAVRAV